MYAQWRSLDDYETMRRDPGSVPYLQEALTTAKFEPGIYDVVESFAPPRVRLIRSRGHLRELSIRRFGRVRRIHVLRIRGTKAGDLNQDGLGTRASEMIHLTGFRVHAAGRQDFQRAFVQAVAIPKLPRAGHDGGHAIVAMGMRGNRRVRGHEQDDRIETRTRRIAEQHLRAHAGQPGTADLIRAGLVRRDFRRR